MNPLNETVVTPEMMKQLRKAGIDEGYEPVPKELEAKAKQLLNGKSLASMDSELKRRVRNLRKRKRRGVFRGGLLPAVCAAES